MAEVVFSTGFTQADGALDSPWVNSGWNGNAGALQVVGNRVRSNAAISTEIPCSVIDQALAADQYIAFSIPTFNVSAGVTIYAVAQLRMAPAPLQTYYRLWASSVAGVTRFDLSSLVNGVETFFGSVTTTIAAGDAILFVAVGTKLSVYRNGVLALEVVDRAVTGQGRAGISIYYTAGAQSDLELDDVVIGLADDLQHQYADFPKPKLRKDVR